MGDSWPPVAEAGLERPHIVAPDVGTSAALFAAATHPERFASVTVGTGGAAVPLQLGEPLRSWVLDPDLDKYRRIGPHVIVETAMGTIAGGVADDVRADYLACYEGDRFVESMRYARRYPEELPELAELLPAITTPVTIINGRHDRVVPVANAEFLDERLPNSRLGIIDAGHFVWEEAPAEYASIILASINGSAHDRDRRCRVVDRVRRTKRDEEVGLMPEESEGKPGLTTTLNVSTEGAVLFAEISAPPMNLLGPELVRDLVSLIRLAEADDSVKVVVFKRGPSWSVGSSTTRGRGRPRGREDRAPDP